MRLLALDLGTTTAYALGDTNAKWPAQAGSWDLAPAADPRLDVEAKWTRRCYSLHAQILALGELDDDANRLAPPIHMIAFENGFHRGRASEFFAGLRWVVRMTAHVHRFSFTHRSPSAIKAYLTGKGGAQKYEMKAAAVERWGSRAEGLTHDEVDALALWFLVRSELEGAER